MKLHCINFHEDVIHCFTVLLRGAAQLPLRHIQKASNNFSGKRATQTHTARGWNARYLTIGFSSRVLSRVCRHGATLSFRDNGLPLSIKIWNWRAPVVRPPFLILSMFWRQQSERNQPPRINLKSIANTRLERERQRAKQKREWHETERKRIMAGRFSDRPSLKHIRYILLYALHFVSRFFALWLPKYHFDPLPDDDKSLLLGEAYT